MGSGSRLTARDFVYSFQRILSPLLLSEYAKMLYPMKNARVFNEGKITDFHEVGVQALDDHTLHIILNGPAPYFPSILKHYSWHPVPRHVIERFGKMTDRDTRWTRAGNMVGNGSYQLKEWRYSHSITVERNPNYWDAATVKLNGLVFIPIVSDTTEDRAFRDGQLHVTEMVPLAQGPMYREQQSGVYRENALLSTYFYRMNVTKPPLDQKLVRQALALAVDRAGLIRNVLRAGQKPTTGFTSPGAGEGYVAPDILRFDPEKVRRLLTARKLLLRGAGRVGPGHGAGRGSDAACAECHRKIAPLGFSLETFDPIGHWRSTYPKPKKAKDGPKIDTTGEFTSGETYTDFASFKKVVHDTRADHFTRHLIRQFLTYTTGRTMELHDDLLIEQLHDKVKKQGLGLKTLMIECLMSEVFRSR